MSHRQPALVDCACEVTVYQDGSGVEIHYCPMHWAAKELLEALRRIMNAQDNGEIHIPAAIGIRASVAIAKAEG